jgi:predicted kinase
MDKKPILYIFSGLPGVGKTTIARELAKQIGAVFIRVDTIENALRVSSLHIHPAEDADYEIGYAIARENLKNGVSVIADSVNPLLITRNAWREIALSIKIQYLEIEITCTDQELHKSRIENRNINFPNQNLPNWAEVLARNYEDWNCEHLTIDTAKTPINKAIAQILSLHNPQND